MDITKNECPKLQYLSLKSTSFSTNNYILHCSAKFSTICPSREGTSGDPCSCIQVQRAHARERVDLRDLESQDEEMDGRIGPQCRDAERTQDVQNENDIVVPLIGEEAADDSLEAAVVKCDDASGGVEAFAFLQGILSNAVAESNQWREGVGELDEADCGSHTC
jgi:hypothetical protein